MEQSMVDKNRVPEEVSVLIGQLKDPKLHYHAAAKLQNFLDHTDAIVPALIDTLNDVDRNVRFAALIALGNLGTSARSAMPALRRIIEEHPDLGMRYVAAWVLEKLDGSREKAMLEQFVKRMNVDSREGLLNLLWELDNDPSWREHITLLREKYVSRADN